MHTLVKTCLNCLFQCNSLVQNRQKLHVGVVSHGTHCGKKWSRLKWDDASKHLKRNHTKGKVVLLECHISVVEKLRCLQEMLSKYFSNEIC